MCNLYNIATNHEAMRRLFPKFGDLTNRVHPQLDLYPDYPAPVLRNLPDGERELAHLHWGMPPPPIGSVAKIPLMSERAPKIFSETIDERFQMASFSGRDDFVGGAMVLPLWGQLPRP